MAKNPENQWKSIKIVNIDGQILHNIRTTWVISMKFSGKMWLMIENTYFEKPQGRSNYPPPVD